MLEMIPKRFLHTTRHRLQSIQKYIYAMNKAYLRHRPASTTETGENVDKFDISFQLVDPQYKINRNFNFTRNLTENVSSFLSRVTTNVEKIYTKSQNKKKKSAETQTNPASNPPEVKVSLYVNLVKITDEVPCNQVFTERNKVTLKLLDKEYEVVINAPFVESIALPNTMLATFPAYPQKFDALYFDENLSLFTWFKSQDKKTWDLIASGYVCTPGEDAIGCYLKLVCLPRNKNHEGPKTEVISDGVVTASPGVCPFERRQEVTKTRSKPNEFRVVTYNILADLYCDSDFTRTELHPYCPPHALMIDYRKQLFIKEILGYNSDIVCLQEVDRKVFNYDLLPVMERNGFGCEFGIKGGQVAEGVACFYQKDKFRLISSEKVHLAENLETNRIFKAFLQVINANEKLKARFIDRQTVTQVVTLESVETRNIVIVANTHLYFHPDADHIRLLQGAMSMKFVEEHYNKIKSNSQYKDKKITIIFCGDFNSVPDCGIYKLFTEGSVGSDFEDWSSNKEEEVKNLSLCQPFKMASACGTPEYTNYTTGFADCLDYIFFDTDTVQVSQQVPMPTNDELIYHTALPSVVFPSDHISLCADLKWK